MQLNSVNIAGSATPAAAKPLLMQNSAAPISKIFIDDLTERKRLWRIPWFIIIMCCVQLALFYIANDCIYQRLMFIPGHPYDYWRYFTYALLHSDFIHLLLNVSLQCMIGFCLESEQGHWEVGFIYAAGGLSGSLATAYSQPELSLLGASASVYALLASHVPHLMKNYRQLPHRYLRIVSLFILCLSDVGFTAFHYLVNHNMNPRICVEAHIAGGLIGLCFGFLLYSSVKGQGYCADCHLSNT
ncbi:protein rhomboid isoform X1 [Anastrepha obliqua]|uniref:protein rhomboid isoform X1 n=1 Tax=Anastrepha obliqua TaxID=95512 RepID=UPI002409BAE6|nr:protein rhomboid isoform X1 [Anastrepha obliqua]